MDPLIKFYHFVIDLPALEIKSHIYLDTFPMGKCWRSWWECIFLDKRLLSLFVLIISSTIELGLNTSNNSTVCPSFHDISDHKPLFVSCYKDSSDGFMKPKKYFKWPRHICNTKSSDILSHNYLSILANELESNENSLSAEEMVDKFFRYYQFYW